MFFLLQIGRCYKAETSTILFPLRYAIAWYYFKMKSKFQILAKNNRLLSGTSTEIAIIISLLHLFLVPLQRGCWMLVLMFQPKSVSKLVQHCGPLNPSQVHCALLLLWFATRLRAAHTRPRATCRGWDTVYTTVQHEVPQEKVSIAYYNMCKPG